MLIEPRAQSLRRGHHDSPTALWPRKLYTTASTHSRSSRPGRRGLGMPSPSMHRAYWAHRTMKRPAARASYQATVPPSALGLRARAPASCARPHRSRRQTLLDAPTLRRCSLPARRPRCGRDQRLTTCSSAIRRSGGVVGGGYVVCRGSKRDHRPDAWGVVPAYCHCECILFSADARDFSPFREPPSPQ